MAELRDARLITKRTSVPGKIPTGTTGNELNFIKSGELASNLADHTLWGFDGVNVFEYGSNSFLGLTGGTVSGDLIITGNSILNIVSATTYFGDGSNLTGISGSTDTFVTGFTYTPNSFTISQNDGSNYSAIIDELSGLTINGVLSINDYTIDSDTFNANRIITIGSDNDSVIASNYIFNDSGITQNDIWSADKIIDFFNFVSSGTGITSLNNLAGAVQFFDTNDDANLKLAINSVSNTHTFNISWDGVLSVERGGTNNTGFTNSEILTYSGQSIISSGYKFNDSGLTNSDIWSAEKIIDYSIQSHNDLSGLQGGQANQYYHLTLNEYNNNALKTDSLITNKVVVSGGLSTTSATDVLMTSLQFTNVQTGEYLANFGTSLSHNSTNSNIWISIYVNGTQVVASERIWQRGGVQANIIAGVDLAGFPLTITTTSTVEIRWRTDAATATSTNRHFTLLRTDRLSI